jgi:hypothetical protein
MQAEDPDVFAQGVNLGVMAGAQILSDRVPPEEGARG